MFLYPFKNEYEEEKDKEHFGLDLSEPITREVGHKEDKVTPYTIPFANLGPSWIGLVNIILLIVLRIIIRY